MCNLNSTPEIHRTTTSPPKQFVAGLTDFEPGRSQLVSNSADKHISIVKNIRRTMRNHASRASVPMSSTWIVVVQIFVLLIAVFLIERHLRKLEHPSRSAIFAYQITLPAPTSLCLLEAGIPCNADGEF